MTRGNLDEGLVAYYLAGDRLVAVLISGQTPETQAELTQLLHARAQLQDPGLLAEAAAPVELAFDAARG